MSSIIFTTAFQQGMLYVFAVFGIVISFRMMNFPDLTVDGSFTLGAAVVAILLAKGCPVYLAVLISLIAGLLAGMATAILNRKLGISKILSGILIMLILYSINLRIMGKANISLLRINNFFTPFQSSNSHLLMFTLAGIALVVLVSLLYFSVTKLGLFIRATGDNEFMVRSQGANIDWIFIIGIGLSNALIAFSGAMVAQYQGFADVSMGIGMIITALAALIIGESFVSVIQSIKGKIVKIYTSNGGRKSHLPWDIFNEFFAAILGSFLYFLIISICLQLGLAPTDLKLATGVLVIIGIALRFQKTASETYQKAKL